MQVRTKLKGVQLIAVYASSDSESASSDPGLAHTFQCEQVGDASHYRNEAKENSRNQTLPQRPALPPKSSAIICRQRTITHHLGRGHFAWIHLSVQRLVTVWMQFVPSKPSLRPHLEVIVAHISRIRGHGHNKFLTKCNESKATLK